MKVLLKISWESLKWEKDFWINSNYVKALANTIVDINKSCDELYIVVWGGNIYRWWDLIKWWVDPCDSHNLSMLSTVFNWVVLKNYIDATSENAVVMSPLGINFVENYSKNNAKKHWKKWDIVILTWWTWNPFFTTDSWWVLRSIELWVDIMIKATRVNWVYDSDPEKNPDAKFFEQITYDEIINQDLKVMDMTAIVLAKENRLRLNVVNINMPWTILGVIKWKNTWTIIKNNF